MATTSRYRKRDEDEDDDRPRRRAPAKKGGPPMVPILALVVVLVGAIVVARLVAKAPAPVEEGPKVDASAIFGDLPEEQPPVPGSGGPGGGRFKVTDKAPSGLTDNATWIAALHTAEEAAALFAKAKDAKAKDDRAKFNEYGNQAKDLYNKAVEDTALWEEELIEKYGDTDRQVRDIMRIRNGWLDVLRTLHKTTGRS
ncbi:MAG: hypothetical protein H6828_04900 [Planctomycetes bacterium]|nr:hypothetical protein [Planctomycetota bacterium]